MRLRHDICLSVLLAALVYGCGPDKPSEPAPQPELSVDEEIAVGIDAFDIEPLAEPEPQDVDKVELGRALFFDKLLSGRLDTSCASCHHPREMTGDDIPLSAGAGATVDGDKRRLGPDRTWTARNSPELFNRGVAEWTTQFWDMRIRMTDTGHMLTPAGSRMPEGLDNLLAAQAMLPVAERDEMRGERWDTDINGEPNELGQIVDGLLNKIWETLITRLMNNPEYRALFASAYPDTPVDQMSFVHAANAIAAFEIDAFSFTQSPWDRYVAGQSDALDRQQKRGAALFFGQANCAQCHSGTLFTDQKPHNLAVPQFGPGKSPDEPFDRGFGRVSNNSDFDFAFRTPTLRNVVLTAPYMHNGAYETLAGAIRHHIEPAASLRAYDGSHLDDDLRQTLQDDAATQERILKTLDSKMKEPAQDGPAQLDDDQIDDLISFMDSLTGEGAAECTDVVPESVPSGLPLD
jgi:cytochrome c peroxidase